MPNRRDLAVAALTAVAVLAVSESFVAHAAPPSGGTAAAASAKPLMRSRIFDSPKIKPEQTKVGERREVFDAPTATLERFASHITTLNPGQAPHPAHKHPEEELMILKEGTL